MPSLIAGRLAGVRTGAPIGESGLVPPDHRGRIVPRAGVEDGDSDLDSGLHEHAVEGLAEKASLVEAGDGDPHARRRSRGRRHVRPVDVRFIYS